MLGLGWSPLSLQRTPGASGHEVAGRRRSSACPSLAFRPPCKLESIHLLGQLPGFCVWAQRTTACYLSSAVMGSCRAMPQRCCQNIHRPSAP